jgi:hypothetical protein
MKRMFSFLMILAFGSSIKCFSQITTNELPISVQKKVVANLSANRSSIVSLPIPDMDRVLKEDQEREENNYLLKRISIGIPISISMNEYGLWTTLDDGGKLWQLQISAENAKALDFVFSKFWLPDSGKFFIFNPLTLETIGAITSEYLLGSKSTPHRFSTAMVKGDNVILEYYQPKGVKDLPIIEVIRAYYVYNPTRIQSCSDEVNVNCSEGADWKKEKNAVARIEIKLQDSYWGTGALLNSTQANYMPLFLTANHCLLGNNDPEPKDALGDSDASDWVFYWNYELAYCDAPNPQSPKTTYGATVIANNPYSDFALLQLQQNPLYLSDYVPYYLGWDRSGSSGTGGVGIHHPQGDVKKISTYSMTPITMPYNSSPSVYWGVNWVATDHGHGITEGGSSGSPLINSSHKVIGQLRGSNNSCSNLLGTSCYGKFDVSWTGIGNSDIRRRLNYWLDPNGTNAQSINGTHPLSISGSTLVCSTATYNIQNYPSGATVVWSTSNSNLSIISGQGTGNATFQKNSNGACVITAQVSAGGTLTLNITKNVWAGSPTAPTIIGWPNTNMFLANSQYQLFASTSSLAQASEYQWDVVSGATITSGANTNGPTFTINSSGTVRIGVRARNACGWGPYTYMNGGITNDNGQTPINSPGNNIVNIPLPEEGEYEIILWNTNRLIRTVKTSQSSYDVDLNGLPSDLYIIKVMKDGQSIYQLKVKK